MNNKAINEFGFRRILLAAAQINLSEDLPLFRALGSSVKRKSAKPKRLANILALPSHHQR